MGSTPQRMVTGTMYGLAAPGISPQKEQSGVFAMTEEELRKKIEEVRLDHAAAGGFISYADAEAIVREAYGLESREKSEES